MALKKDKAPPPSSKLAKSGGGKQKKWSKGKQKYKVDNMVLFDQSTYDKLLSEAPKFKLITSSTLSDRLTINGTISRKAIRELMARGSIRMVAAQASQQIYTESYKHLGVVLAIAYGVLVGLVKFCLIVCPNTRSLVLLK